MSLAVEHVGVKLGGQVILDDVNFRVAPAECMAIVGASGSGKTTLLKALSGNLYHSGTVQFEGKPRISVISRQHRFNNLSNISSFYYQQRFNSFDAEDSGTVASDLEASGFTGEQVDAMLGQLGIMHVKAARLIQLSNGEHKRFQIAKALLNRADWILLDSPYIGLDVGARATLNAVLNDVVASGVKILLVTGHGEIPSCVTKVGILEKGRLSAIMDPQTYLQQRDAMRSGSSYINTAAIPAPAYVYPDFEFAIRMSHVNVSYGERKILDNINWEVRKGECWNVSGHNGSGKSTLLSLINGDNPQAFANQIWLFDKRKGSGESIWDIKRMIGYVSPELHHYFDGGMSCADVVASGLFDTIGLFRPLSDAQLQLVSESMRMFGIMAFRSRMFHTLSDGEQRKVLLARAMVKGAPVLLLDEPCQGLDDDDTQAFIHTVDAICRSTGKTLIYVTHYEAEIPGCVTRRLVLENGKMKTGK